MDCMTDMCYLDRQMVASFLSSKSTLPLVVTLIASTPALIIDVMFCCTSIGLLMMYVIGHREHCCFVLCLCFMHVFGVACKVIFLMSACMVTCCINRQLVQVLVNLLNL